MLLLQKMNRMNLLVGIITLIFSLTSLPQTSGFFSPVSFHSRQILASSIQSSQNNNDNKNNRYMVSTDAVEDSPSLDDGGNDDSVVVQESKPQLDVQEQVWRFVKKPLLHIGSKGATKSHGNSLRQLLEDHTVVKVKVNTRKFGGSLENAANALKDIAVENGASVDIEIIQMRDYGNIVLYGIPGTLQRMEDGSFPPPPPPPKEEEEDAELSP